MCGLVLFNQIKCYSMNRLIEMKLKTGIENSVSLMINGEYILFDKLDGMKLCVFILVSSEQCLTL